MTEKLYYEDVYCREFTAVVTGCTETENGYEITLDRTAFYPEGGGQPADHGQLQCMKTDSVGTLEAAVYDVHEKNGGVFHYTNLPLPVGDRVIGRIDWERRFDLMQNHSGEHIVSGLIHEKYGYQNVGFHMGSDVLTIDLDGEITADGIREVERCANQVVWANRPTDVRVYDEEEIKNLEYRSKKELHGEVRIVTFPGADVCACCGTHVGYAGEIGLIKLLSVQKFRSGVRIEMICGSRALNYVNEICDQNHRISVALSAKPMETAEAVSRLKESAAQESFRMVALENELLALKAAAFRGMGDVIVFEEMLSPDSLRKLAVAVMECCGGRCAVFSGDDVLGYKYAIGETNGDLRALVKEINAGLNGRGGGKPFFAQGSVSAKQGEIIAFLKERGFRSASVRI